MSMALTLRPQATPEDFQRRSAGYLPGWFGLEVTAIAPGRLEMAMPIRPEMLAPNGFLHAASVIALADTAAGFATIAHLPEGAESFTTIELKSNFFASQRQGRIRCVASAVHGGRQTQVWDAEVFGDDDRRLALFRCTQMILWPRGQA